MSGLEGALVFGGIFLLCGVIGLFDAAWKRWKKKHEKH